MSGQNLDTEQYNILNEIALEITNILSKSYTFDVDINKPSSWPEHSSIELISEHICACLMLEGHYLSVDIYHNTDHHRHKYYYKKFDLHHVDFEEVADFINKRQIEHKQWTKIRKMPNVRY